VTGASPAAGTYLARIVAAHRAAAAGDTRPLEPLLDAARGAASTVRPFGAAIRAASVRGSTVAVVAEVKRRSPSKGDLATDLDAAALAAAYEAGGAAALSVLTDADHFGGSADDLRTARAAVRAPVLRKDFTVAPHDVCDARLMGADAVLLIVAALDDAELRDFAELAASLGLDALVEVHDGAEVDRALAIGADIVGVNQRDLVTFAVDTDRAERLVSRLPDGVVRVAESGITGGDDARRLAAAGYDAVLVGEHLVRSGDPAAAVRELRGAGITRR
jgi:indole-3-glycerol phosphate synthase